MIRESGRLQSDRKGIVGGLGTVEAGPKRCPIQLIQSADANEQLSMDSREPAKSGYWTVRNHNLEAAIRGVR
jgi:hypothetical protein